MIALWLFTALSFAEITLESPPAMGVKNYVVLTDVDGRPRGGETVRVIHRPGLYGEREMAIGITDALGRAEWNPAASGVTRLIAGEEELALNVAWPTPPTNSIVLLFLLLVAGLGASAYGMLGPPTRKT